MDNVIPPLNLEVTPLKKPWHKRPIFFALITLAVFLGYYAYQIGAAYNTISVENGSINKPEASDPNPMPEPEKDRLDILLLGIRGENASAIEEEGGLLTDTIMIASIDKKTKKAAMISIPRDVYINIDVKAPNGKKITINGKINEVYERGLENGGGIPVAKQVFSRITNTYIDNVVVMDFNAFQQIVNNLGGIDIHLAKPFEEKSQWGYDFLLPAGDNHLDGQTALYYVRSRFSTSDFDRARRQQEVISIIKNKALSLGFLANPIKITQLLSDLKGNIRTDFQIWNIKDMLTVANTFSDKTAAKNYIISTDNLLNETKNVKGEYILLPKEPNFVGIKKLFKEIFQS